MDGDLAHGLREQIEAWRAQGADRVDPVRFGLIEALARRAEAHDGEARRLLDLRLAQLAGDHARDLAQAAPDAAARPQDRAMPGALGALLAHMPHRSREADPYPELPLLERFRTLWTSLRTEAQLRQSLAPVADDAGPLNSTVLVHRSLTLMRTLSPGYLQHFIAYVDALSSLERLRQAGTPVATGTSRAEGARKPTRGRARRKVQD